MMTTFISGPIADSSAFISICSPSSLWSALSGRNRRRARTTLTFATAGCSPAHAINTMQKSVTFHQFTSPS
jgi:hypothetical protein